MLDVTVVCTQGYVCPVSRCFLQLQRAAHDRKLTRILNPRRTQVPFSAIRDMLMDMLPTLQGRQMSAEDLTLLRSIIPNEAERKAVNAFKGDPTTLGVVERFFMAILAVPAPVQRLNALLYWVRFESLANELQAHLTLLEAACLEVLGWRSVCSTMHLMHSSHVRRFCSASACGPC